jgi:ATP-dependent helicase HrpA
MIQPEWIEKAAGHLVKHNYSEPHWEKRRGQVAGYEKVTLFGITLIPRRKINFSPIDPVTSREIFIGSALVDGDFHTRAPFWRHNQELTEAIHDLEAKSRRRDILVDEARIYSFYEERIPEGISTTPGFEKWLRQQSKQQPKLLFMKESDLVREESQRVSSEQFPDHLEVNGMQLPLEYEFEPGSAKDGVTLVVPQDVLNQITEARLQWLVPGLLRESVISLIRGLPKTLRRSFVPVPDFADACLADLPSSDRPLIQVLGERLKQLSGVHIPEDAWSEEDIPDHLRMRLRVVDQAGATLEQGRDLAGMKRRHAGQPQAEHRHLNSPGFERSGLRDWDFEQLPKQLRVEQGGIALQGYPALVDEEESVAIRLLDAQSNALQAHKQGVRRLLMLKMPKEIRYLRKNLNQLDRMRLLYAKVPVGDEIQSSPAQQDLEDELVAFIVDRTFLNQLPEIRDRNSFTERLNSRRGMLMQQANSSCQQLLQILELSHQVRQAISAVTQVNWMSSIMDMQQQLERLVFRGFLRQVPDERLNDYPRYLQGILKRVEKLSHAAARDQQRMREMGELQQRWEQWHMQYQRSGRLDERIEELRWALEELRISLFSQELGTAYPISIKRLQKRIKEMGL